MRRYVPFRAATFYRFTTSLTLLLLCACFAQAQVASSVGAEQRAARFFESIRKSPPQQLAFLLKMPKGGDLHNHLSGSVYAERYIEWAADNGLCVNQTTFALSQPPCDQGSGQLPATNALTNGVLYRQMIDAWSMRFWEFSGQNGHDRFFDTFGKFGAATYGQTGRMLADAAARAARGHVSYLELMLTPDGIMSSQLGGKIGWDGNFQGTYDKLRSGGIADAATAGIKALQEAETEKDKILQCGTQQADAGCGVTIRYISQVSRGAAPGAVFAQMVTGFALANDPSSKVVALNLVQAEDGLVSMRDFRLHMQMLKFLRPLYPRARVTLHAGELAPGIVPPEGLGFHIRESVLTASAERIGHGVDIMHETEPYELLKEMARRGVLVEICLTSNDVILGIRGTDHPLATYMQYGVPVTLATDDEGVSRSEISREYLRAAMDQGLGYAQLKTMARNSLHYSFLPGASLWSDARKFSPVTQCGRDAQSLKLVSDGCRQFLAGSERARLQWKLEEDFRVFENQY
ncbi:MAG: adenosine deaminase [Acidobacteria bacterium]|nr:adenosine deaminase [Acidobacteriota bacterium]